MNRRAASLDHPSSAAANRRPWELAHPDDVHWFSYAQTAGDDGIWGAFLYMYVAVTPLICDATFDGSLHRQGTRASIVVGDSDKSRANRIKSRDNSEEVSKFAEVSGEVAALDNVCTISLIPTKDLPEEPADQAGWLAAAQTGEPEALERFFHMSETSATALMLVVHTTGRGIIGLFTRDVAETKVAEVHEHAREYGMPLRLDVEPEDD